MEGGKGEREQNPDEIVLIDSDGGEVSAHEEEREEVEEERSEVWKMEDRERGGRGEGGERGGGGGRGGGEERGGAHNEKRCLVLPPPRDTFQDTNVTESSYRTEEEEMCPESTSSGQQGVSIMLSDPNSDVAEGTTMAMEAVQTAFAPVVAQELSRERSRKH